MGVRRKLTVGVTTVAVAAFAGGAYAATQDSGANSRQAFLNDVAKRLHVSPQQLTAALKGAQIDQLNAAVASGRLTQAQANALKQKIEQGGAVPGVLFGVPAPLLGGAAAGYGPPGFGPGCPASGPPAGLFRPKAKLSRAAVPPGALLAPARFRCGPRTQLPVPAVGMPGTFRSAGSYLGLSPRQLLTQFAKGRTLAQIAKAQGKSVSGLENALTSAARAQIEAAVKAKLITQAQAQAELTKLPAQIAAQVNHPGPPFFPGRVPGFFPGRILFPAPGVARAPWPAARKPWPAVPAPPVKPRIKGASAVSPAAPLTPAAG